MFRIFILALLFSTSVYAGPAAKDIEEIKISSQQLYLTDQQNRMWIIEPICSYDVTAQSSVVVRYGENKIRTGRRIIVSVDGNPTHCRIGTLRRIPNGQEEYKA
jgi:hypothetical protein